MHFLGVVILVTLAFYFVGRLLQATSATAAGTIATAQIIYDALPPAAREQVDAAAAERRRRQELANRGATQCLTKPGGTSITVGCVGEG
jgi:hypothetical protein